MLLVNFPNFWGKKVFLENSALLRTTSYEFLEPYQNLEKSDDTILRKRPDRRKDERTEGQTDGRTDGRKDGNTAGRIDRPYFIEPFQLRPGLQ